MLADAEWSAERFSVLNRAARIDSNDLTRNLVFQGEADPSALILQKD
jgi:hypothetical protein